MEAPIHSVEVGGGGERGSKEMEFWMAMATPLAERPEESDRRMVKEGSLKFLREGFPKEARYSHLTCEQDQGVPPCVGWHYR